MFFAEVRTYPLFGTFMFEGRSIRLLYIAGRGFDTRAQAVMNAFVGNVRLSGHSIDRANLLLVGLAGYRLSNELKEQTEKNATALEEAFRPLGKRRGCLDRPLHGWRGRHQRQHCPSTGR